MGKKIYITENQLDYVIKNIDRLNEQTTGNKKQYSDEEIAQWIIQNFQLKANGDVNLSLSKLGVKFGGDRDGVASLWNNKKVDPQSKKDAVEVVKKAFNESERGPTLDEWRNKNRDPKGKGQKLVNLNVIPGSVVMEQTKAPQPVHITIDPGQDGFPPFADNDATVSQSVIDAIQSAHDQLQKYKDMGMSVTITAIGIETSSSRLRNLGNFKGETWAKLSTDRLDSAVSQIGSIFRGYKLPGIAKDATGFNKDGSSGEHPYEDNAPNKIVTGGEVDTNGKGFGLKMEYAPKSYCDKNPNVENCGVNRTTLDSNKFIHIFIAAIATKPTTPTKEYRIPFIIKFTDTKGGDYETTPPDKDKDKTKLPKPYKMKSKPGECAVWAGKKYRGGIANKLFASPTSTKQFPTGKR